MPRFQAQTNPILDEELELLRERLGLRESQKADLLREIASIAVWVVRQAEDGRMIEARRGRDIQVLKSPALDRLREQPERRVMGRVELSDAEVERLAEVLDRGFAPTPALQKALARLASGRRAPPKLRWPRRDAR